MANQRSRQAASAAAVLASRQMCWNCWVSCDGGRSRPTPRLKTWNRVPPTTSSASRVIPGSRLTVRSENFSSTHVVSQPKNSQYQATLCSKSAVCTAM